MGAWRSDGWVQVAEAPADWQAELIAGGLRAAGLEAKVVDQTFRQEPLPSVRSFAIVRVLVPEDQEARAREVLAEAEQHGEPVAEEPVKTRKKRP
jgi:hypothetical protein